MRKSFCLQPVSSFKDINLSPLNSSKSKFLWTFSKDSRFKKPLLYCDSFYQSKSTFKKNGTSIGYGNKTDFTKNMTAAPPSTKYRITSLFENNIKSKKGFSMSLNRQQIPQKGYIPLQPLRFPGPNKYQNLKLDSGKSYSLRKRTKVLDKTMTIESQNNNPGPGKYQNPQALSPLGRYNVSKHKGTGAGLFNPKRSTRFFQFKNQVPGPGTYKQINELSDKGYYPITRTHGYGKRIFDKQKRVVQFQKNSKLNLNPGPGAYRAPSDFGQYDGDVYNTSQILKRTIKKY